MVYNEMVYKPATLGERLQAKFGARISSAVKNGSGMVEGTQGEVLSFFGKTTDNGADRAVPYARHRTAADSARVSVPRASVPQSRVRNGVHTKEKTAKSARAVSVKVKTPSVEVATAFSRAYAKSDSTRRITAAAGQAPRRQYAPGAVPEGALRRGRSNIPGARHAVLKTDSSADITVRAKVKGAFATSRVAEHKAEKAPFPIAFVTLIVICTFMVMAILFSFARIGEYSDKINALKAEQRVLDETAAKLELQLAEKEDIRYIEDIAVNEIGMVSSDMVQTKFVSVAGAERVEVMGSEKDDEKSGGAFSAILSVFGEYFD